MALLPALTFGWARSTAVAAPDGAPAPEEFAVQVVSSAPHQVTGGDARLHIAVPRTVPLQQVEVRVNGVDQRSRSSLVPDTRTLTG